MYIIREAKLEDCRGIAEVQVDSYRAAYVGLFPPAYLAHFTYEEEEQDWHSLLTSDTSDILLVAIAADNRVIGYTLARAQPDIYLDYDAEIVALHVNRAFQQQGIGTALLTAAVTKLTEHDCKSVMLWTLQNNPNRRWYTSLQGKLIGEKAYEVDNWRIVEIAYGWDPITTLLAQLK